MKRYPPSLFLLPLVIATATVLGGCQTTYPESAPADFQVSLDRAPCFGTCPVYSLTVFRDGLVVFNGINFVNEEGLQEASLPPEQVIELFQTLVAADFFGFQDRYEVAATDLPSITTTVIMNGRTKAVYHYGLGCGTDFDLAPPSLCDIEALLESIPASNGWISFE